MVRDRYSSVKRGLTDGSHSPNKMRNVGLPAVVGTRTQEKIREIKSPPADLFLSGINKGITKHDINDDLDKADIKITADDLVLMSIPRKTSNIVSYRVSEAAEDLQKSLFLAVWPLRVRDREFIHYQGRYSAAARGEKMIAFGSSTAIG